MSNGEIPDIRKDSALWFDHFDRDHNGIDKQEFIAALKATFKLDSHSSYELGQSIDSIWGIFDHDLSGTISKAEFLRPGGLSETIIAQMQNYHVSSVSSSSTVNTSKEIQCNYENQIKEVQAIFPDISKDKIYLALTNNNGNMEQTVNYLMLKDTEEEIGNYLPVPPPISTSTVDNTFRCGKCNIVFQVNMINIPNGTKQLIAPCPECKTKNQINLSKPIGSNYSVSTTTVNNNNSIVNNNIQEFKCGRCYKHFSVNMNEIETHLTNNNNNNQVVIKPCSHCHTKNQLNIAAISFNNNTNNYTPHAIGTVMNIQNNPNNTNNVYRPLPNLPAQPAPIHSNTIPIIRNGGKNKKRALLIGINYRGQKGQLRGCINDVKNIYRLLTVQYGWKTTDIRILVDETIPNLTSILPTKANIISSLHWLVKDVMPGDALFFSFSGHGAQVEDPHGIEEDGMNETILPLDYKTNGMITDDEISIIIVQPLPEGVRLTALLDSCHSGTGLDLPYTWTTTTRRFLQDTNPYHSLGDVQLFSGCEDGGTSADAQSLYNASGGAMTTAFCTVLLENPCPTYTELLDLIKIHLKRHHYRQKPQLSSSQIFDVNRPFLLEDAVPNSNQFIGRTIRKKFPPKRRIYQDDVFNSMIGVGLLTLGSFAVADFLF